MTNKSKANKSMTKNVFKRAVVALAMSIALTSTAMAAQQQGFWSWLFTMERMKEVAPVSNESYQEECGSCHFAYQPGWLPAASWKKLLDAKALENHFKENAELDDALRMKLLNFLVENSAETSRYKRSRKVMASLGDVSAEQAPLRITEVPYIRRKHHEVVEDVLKKNSKVKSLSYCDDCHQMAAKNSFDDDTVKIPDYGHWTW